MLRRTLTGQSSRRLRMAARLAKVRELPILLIFPDIYLQRGMAGNAIAPMNFDQVTSQFGTTGRQSVSGIVATVWGGSSFVGRYVVAMLGRVGSQCIVPYRGDGMNVRHLKISGDLGQIVPVPCEIADAHNVERAMARSNVAINLIGSRHETIHYTYNDAHVKTAYRIAKIAKEQGVERFIHFSALGASEHASNAFFQSKWEGEQVVRDVFPEATILRPAPIFGMEDKFLARWANMIKFMPFLPEFGNSLEQRVQPVYVADVAQAVLACITAPNAPGGTYQLAGPEALSLRELISWVERETYRKPKHIAWFPAPLGNAVNFMWSRGVPNQARKYYFSEDYNFEGDTPPDLVEAAGTMGLKDLGVGPTSLGHAGSNLMLRWRAVRGPQFQGHIPTTVQERAKMRDYKPT